eukprot:5133993-Amphidinium_carterae.1
MGCGPPMGGMGGPPMGGMGGMGGPPMGGMGGPPMMGQGPSGGFLQPPPLQPGALQQQLPPPGGLYDPF